MIESIDTSLIDWSGNLRNDRHVPLDFCSAHSRIGSSDGYHGNAVLQNG